MKKTLYPLKIDLDTISTVISENNISENDTIYLHQEDFDELALQYRNSFGYSIKIPFYYNGVLICENYSTQINTIRFDKYSSMPETHEDDS